MLHILVHYIVIKITVLTTLYPPYADFLTLYTMIVAQGIKNCRRPMRLIPSLKDASMRQHLIASAIFVFIDKTATGDAGRLRGDDRQQRAAGQNLTWAAADDSAQHSAR